MLLLLLATAQWSLLQMLCGSYSDKECGNGMRRKDAVLDDRDLCCRWEKKVVVSPACEKPPSPSKMEGATGDSCLLSVTQDPVMTNMCTET